MEQDKYEFIVLDEQRKPNVYAISSLCEDGTHVIFWDFDVLKQPKHQYKIETSLKNIQRSFLLSKIYLFESRNGYNAVCLDKLDKNTVGNIKNLTPYDDKKHLDQGILYNWKLRIGTDKKLISQIDVAKFHKVTMSNSHRLALNKMFGTNIEYNNYFDDNRKLCLYSYWDWKIANELNELSHAKTDEEIEITKKQCTEDDSFSYTMR